jgi:hypothetical protein
MAVIENTTNEVLRARRTQNTVTASTTFYEGDAGQDFNIATDALVMTLPLIDSDNLGMEFVFRNTGANGNNIITLSPASADGINGRISTAAADGTASGTVNKDWINTKATAKLGDFVRLRAIALTKWFIEDGQGVWASEA